MQKRWDGPFDEKGLVFNFLVRMREGATIRLFRTVRTSGIEDPELLGWFRKQRGARFAAHAPDLGQRVFGDSVGLHDASDAVVAMRPGYALHDSQWSPGEDHGPVTSVTQRLSDMVRRVIEDPESGGSGPLKRHKEKHRDSSRRHPDFLAGSALLSLGYKDTPQRVLDELAPTAEEAFGVFEKVRPVPDS